jgi:ankyrin repeat protein
MQAYDDLIRLLLDKSSSIETTLELIDKNQSLLRRCDHVGNLPIHIECSHQCRSRIVERFIQYFPESLVVANKYGYLPLHEVLSLQSSPLDIALMMIDKRKRSVEHVANNGNLPLHIEVANQCRHEVIEACVKCYRHGLLQPNLAEDQPLNILLRNDRCSAESALMMMTSFLDTVKHMDKTGDSPIHTECSKKCRYDVIMKAIDLYPGSLAICDESGRFPLLVLMRNRLASARTIRAVTEKYIDCLKSNHINIKDLPVNTALFTKDAQNNLSKCVKICPESVVVALSLRYLRVRDFIELPCLHEHKLLEIVGTYPNILKINHDYSGNLIHVECASKCRVNVLSAFITISPESLSMADRDGNLPLHILLRCKYAPSNIVRMVIGAYEEALLHQSTSKNLPIHIECLHGYRIDVLSEMINSRPEILSMANSTGYLPLHSLLMNPFWNRSSSVASIELLLNAFPQALREKTKNDNTPLHIECSNQHRDEVISQLVDLYPDAVNIPNGDGHLPIHLSLKNQYPSNASAQLLINTFSSSQADNEENYPLHIECSHKYNGEYISQLIESYPEALSKYNRYGYLPLHLILKNKSSSITSAQLIINAFPESTRRKDNEGNYPLHIECGYQCRFEVISQLIELCPDALLQTNQQRNLPLHLLLRNQSSFEAILLVMDKCPEAILYKDDNGDLPIVYESMHNFRLEVISKFIQLHPPYLRSLLAQESVYWSRILQRLNTTNFRVFYPILFKILASNPVRYQSLLGKLMLIDDSFCGRLILNYDPPSAFTIDPVLIQKYRSYNWQSRSKILIFLSNLMSSYSSSIIAFSSLDSSESFLSDGNNSQGGQSSSSVGFGILLKLVQMSSSCVTEDNKAVPAFSGNDIGNCLLRSVIKFL